VVLVSAELLLLVIGFSVRVSVYDNSDSSSTMKGGQSSSQSNLLIPRVTLANLLGMQAAGHLYVNIIEDLFRLD
jgi:hypothetical protein